MQQLTQERDALVIAKDGAVQQTVELQRTVEELKQEVREARSAGTPHGGWAQAGYDVGWPAT